MCPLDYFEGFILLRTDVEYMYHRAGFTWINQFTLQWRHNEHNGVSNHQRLDCLLNRLFRRRLKKTLKLRVTGLCEGNSPVTDEFPHKGRVTRFDDVIMRQLFNNEHPWVKQFKEDTNFTVSLIRNSIAHMLIFPSTFYNIQWVCLCVIFFIFSIWERYV